MIFPGLCKASASHLNQGTRRCIWMFLDSLYTKFPIAENISGQCRAQLAVARPLCMGGHGGEMWSRGWVLSLEGWPRKDVSTFWLHGSIQFSPPAPHQQNLLWGLPNMGQASTCLLWPIPIFLRIWLRLTLDGHMPTLSVLETCGQGSHPPCL